MKLKKEFIGKRDQESRHVDPGAQMVKSGACLHPLALSQLSLQASATLGGTY